MGDCRYLARNAVGLPVISAYSTAIAAEPGTIRDGTRGDCDNLTELRGNSDYLIELRGYSVNLTRLQVIATIPQDYAVAAIQLEYAVISSFERGSG